MNTLSNFDVNELILQLHGELKFAFEVANSTGKQAGMQMQKLKVKFGKQNLAEVNDDDEESILLNSDRYPSDEDWELEVDYKYGDPVPDVPSSENWSVGTNSQLVLERLANNDIIEIKGVSTYWKSKLFDEGIKSVGDLAKTSNEKIISICNKYGSMKPLEFQTKVLLLVRDFKPLKFKIFANIPLFYLLEKPMLELKRIFQNKLSGPEISELRAIASIVFLCFDKDLSSKFKMELLSN
ncbi:MAG: hypothetical protein C0598_05845 [Marinilabiliales bacterium]|nr:MAG: hypothetical protein C0598_05845 [Marinilabiliales bacterium]